MTLETALAAPTVRLFAAVKIVGPGTSPGMGTIRLLDGSGTVAVDGEDYTSTSTHGVMSRIEAFSDGVAAEAPRIRLTLDFTDPDQVADFLDLNLQGSAVTVYEGVLDMGTGLVVEEPEAAFIGELDMVRVSVTFGGYSVEIDIASVFERFFDNNEGARLSPAWHKTFWPGELGFDQVTGINRKLPWGVGGGGTGFKGGKSNGFVWFHKPFTGGHLSNSPDNGMF
jgi:hypothetical protein